MLRPASSHFPTDAEDLSQAGGRGAGRCKQRVCLGAGVLSLSAINDAAERCCCGSGGPWLCSFIWQLSCQSSKYSLRVLNLCGLEMSTEGQGKALAISITSSSITLWSLLKSQPLLSLEQSAQFTASGGPCLYPPSDPECQPWQSGAVTGWTSLMLIFAVIVS